MTTKEILKGSFINKVDINNKIKRKDIYIRTGI